MMRYEIDVLNGDELFFTTDADSLNAAKIFATLTMKFPSDEGFRVDLFEITETRRLATEYMAHPVSDSAFYVKLAQLIVFDDPADLPKDRYDRPALVAELISELKIVFGSRHPTRAEEIADKVAQFLIEHDYELMILFFRAAVDSSKHGHKLMANAFTEIMKRRLAPMLLPHEPGAQNATAAEIANHNAGVQRAATPSDT